MFYWSVRLFQLSWFCFSGAKFKPPWSPLGLVCVLIPNATALFPVQSQTWLLEVDWFPTSDHHFIQCPNYLKWRKKSEMVVVLNTLWDNDNWWSVIFHRTESSPLYLLQYEVQLSNIPYFGILGKVLLNSKSCLIF